MPSLVRKSSVACKAETSYGVNPTLAGTNMFEFVDCTLDYDEEYLRSERIRNSKSQFEGVLGSETVAGDVTVELHGVVTNGQPPETDPMWQGVFGTYRTNTTATTSTSGNTTTQITVTAGTGYNAGDIVMVDPSAGGSGAYEVVFITTKASATQLNVTPYLTTSAPGTRTVYGGRQYLLNAGTGATGDALPSLFFGYWRGDVTSYGFGGCKIASLAIDFTAGQPVRPRFSIQGQAVATLTSSSNTMTGYAPQTAQMMIARYMDIKLSGAVTNTPLVSLSLNITNDLQRMMDMTTAGTQNILQTARSVTGSFSLMYENKDIEDAFRAGTTATLMVACSSPAANGYLVLGNTFAIFLPKIKYTKAGKSNDNGMWRYDISFEAIAGGTGITPVGGTTAGVEDEIFAAFL